MKVIIYTDGSCIGNPGPGGWAAKLSIDMPEGLKYAKTISGNEARTTNNRMELMAVVKAINLLRKPCTVHLYSDSAYVIANYARIPMWAARGWENSTGKAGIKNQDLWAELDKLVRTKGIDLRFKKVAGHAGVTENEEMDVLAKSEARKLT